MPVAFTCSCGKSLRIPDEYLGRKVRCPKCRQVSPVPGTPSQPSVAPRKPAVGKRKTSSKRRLYVISAGVAAALIAVIAVVLFALPTDDKPDEPTEVAQNVPDSSPVVEANSTTAGSVGIPAEYAEATLTESEHAQSTPDVASDVSDELATATEVAAVDQPSHESPAPSSSEPSATEEPIDNASVPPVSSEAHPETTTEPSPTDPTPTPQPPAPQRTFAAPDPPPNVTRSRQEVLALIEEVGRTPPDWYDATPLNYPKSLDLSWPEKPEGNWNSQKNVGQFIWDVINPNPGRWREGVRLMHHLLSVNSTDRDKLARIMNELGRIYHELLQDYPRAAFWYQNAGIGKGSRFERSKNGAHLAECYWRMGNRPMAVALLNKLPLTFESIKLWGDIGETEKCVQLATRAAPSARWPAMCHLIAGDAYRTAGDFDRALAAYEKALRLSQKPDDGKGQLHRKRAEASVTAIKVIEKLDLARIPDGSYASSSIGYEAQVHIEVTVQSGRIVDVRVTQHREKQFYSALEDTPRKIMWQQGIKGVDATSGATITSEAIINATAKALVGAQQ